MVTGSLALQYQEIGGEKHEQKEVRGKNTVQYIGREMIGCDTEGGLVQYSTVERDEGRTECS